MNYAKFSAKRKALVFNFVFENSFDDIVFLLQRMNVAGVKPESEMEIPVESPLTGTVREVRVVRARWSREAT